VAESIMRPDGFHRAKCLLAACFMVLVATATFGADTTAIEGTVHDAEGHPVPECRVVARLAEGTAVFISAPSDTAGHYAVDVPTGERYVLVALISPVGVRVGLPEAEPLIAAGGQLFRDLQVEFPAAPRPRTGMNAAGGVDRLFLSFVEDPAMTDGQYLEVQASAARDSTAADLDAVAITAAFTFAGLPRIEVGARTGYGETSSGGLGDGSGAQDLELWGKFHLRRSANARWDVAVGALVTVPTGDEKAGLSADSTRAEWFVAASRTFASAIVIGHAGVAANEGGEIAGTPLDGEVAASAGLGLLVPFSTAASAVFEVSYDGARFEQTDSESRILAGMNWQVHLRGKVRAAVAAGLDDTSADAELIVGYAFAF